MSNAESSEALADASQLSDEDAINSSSSSLEDTEEGEAGAPLWMCTFADLVTLLMCFFVLLFAMSSTQQESFKELIQSLRSALGVQQVPESGTREGLTMHKVPEEPPKEEAVDELGGMVQKEIDEITSEVRELIMFNQLAGQVKVSGDELGATITISDVLLFPAGGAAMTKEGIDIIRKIVNILSQFSYHINIAGHTDNIPIKTARYASNWELSANRACEVVRILVDEGLDPSLISAEGYAEYRPITTNDTAAGRAQNRRVEIVYERRAIAEGLKNETGF